MVGSGGYYRPPSPKSELTPLGCDEPGSRATVLTLFIYVFSLTISSRKVQKRYPAAALHQVVRGLGITHIECRRSLFEE